MLYIHDQLYKHIYICMQNHNDTIKTSDTVLWKIYLSLYLNGLCVKGSWRPNRTATYWPSLYWPSLLGCSTGGLGAQPLWVLVFSVASYFQLVWSPTDWISCALSYIIVKRPPTGCTCYLYRCISYFDRPAGSVVNMQQLAKYYPSAEMQSVYSTNPCVSWVWHKTISNGEAWSLELWEMWSSHSLPLFWPVV